MDRTNITSISPLHFARPPKSRTIVGWFTDWPRSGQASAILVHRKNGTITCASLPLEQAEQQQRKNEITEGEARGVDPEVVEYTAKRYKQVLREGLLRVLGGTGPSAEALFAETHYIEVQRLYIESVALYETIEQLVQEVMQEEEEGNKQRKRQFAQVGRIARAYRGYCLRDLLNWLRELIITRGDDLLPLPMEQKMKLLIMLSDPQLEPTLQKQLAETALSIDTRQGQQQ